MVGRNIEEEAMIKSFASSPITKLIMKAVAKEEHLFNVQRRNDIEDDAFLTLQEAGFYHVLPNGKPVITNLGKKLWATITSRRGTRSTAK